GGSFGGTAHVDRSIYVPCNDGLIALRLARDGRSFEQAWRSSTFDAGPPIVAGGLVWAIDLSSSALVGFDPATGHEVVRRALDEGSHPGARDRSVPRPDPAGRRRVSAVPATGPDPGADGRDRADDPRGR